MNISIAHGSQERSVRSVRMFRLIAALLFSGTLGFYFFIWKNADVEKVDFYFQRQSKASCNCSESDNQNESSSALSLCPIESPYLIGRVNPDIMNLSCLTIEESVVIKSFPDLKPGGYWKPSICKPRQKIAIIIPFRDRHEHLPVLLAYLIPILKRQLLEFFFVISEQLGDELYNKGRLFNAGFQYALKLNADCMVFHDVDMVPEDDRNPYLCADLPRHIAPFTDELEYELWYDRIVGGVLSMIPGQFKLVNGYSNMFWGWGAEDEDMGLRIVGFNMKIQRPSPLIGRYRMLKHSKRKASEGFQYRMDLLHNSAERAKTDGLSENLWNITSVEIKPLYHWLKVDVGEIPPRFRKARPPTTRPSSTPSPKAVLIVGKAPQQKSTTLKAGLDKLSTPSKRTDLKNDKLTLLIQQVMALEAEISPNSTKKNVTFGSNYNQSIQ